MEDINDSKQIKTSPVKTSPIIEERKIPEDELSLIIDTVNKIQTFLGEQKETLKKITTEEVYHTWDVVQDLCKNLNEKRLIILDVIMVVFKHLKN